MKKLSEVKKLKNILYLLLPFLISSCEFMEPERDNTLFESQVLSGPALAEGYLITAYQNMPNTYTISAAATDDAVTNDVFSNYRKVANGEWRATLNPFSTWNSYNEIYHINKFLEIVDSIQWSLYSPREDSLQRIRLKGEAHGLRAWYYARLLRAHAGLSADGQMLGVPILTKPLKAADKPVVSRSSLADCIDFVLADIDIAMANLPNEYKQILNYPDSNNAFGDHWVNRMDRRAARALQSRFTLWAASPAIAAGRIDADVLWSNAAKAAGSFIADEGGLSVLGTSNSTFWTSKVDKDNIWRADEYNPNNENANVALERSNFPPSFFGNGSTNPTQNLVDAFPMANGFPISNAASGYDDNDPYTGRDPRLAAYIIYNGSTFKGATVATHTDTIDGLNELTTSTRTGYYMRKLLVETIRLDKGSVTKGVRIYSYFRYTEVLLNFAEAANEAWGPMGDSNSYGFTAVDAIGAIRARAGITQPDEYLGSIQNNKDAMRELIRNERRLELCFEGFRFWDLRRWNSSDINAVARGMKITKNANGTFSYEEIPEVEKRLYHDYQIYGPIPYSETIKYDNLTQNQGW